MKQLILALIVIANFYFIELVNARGCLFGGGNCDNLTYIDELPSQNEQQQSRERYFAVTGSTCYTGDNRTYCCFSSPEHYASYRSERPNARPEGNESGLEYTGACAKLESQQAAEQQQRQAAEQQWQVEEQQWQNSQQQYDQNGYPVGVSTGSFKVSPGGQLIPQPPPVRPMQ